MYGLDPSALSDRSTLPVAVLVVLVASFLLVWLMRSSIGNFMASFALLIVSVAGLLLAENDLHREFAALLFLGAILSAAIGGVVRRLEEILAAAPRSNEAITRASKEALAAVERVRSDLTDRRA
jgi:hypothetical protein